MLAGQHLAHGKYDAARETYRQAAASYKAAGATGEALMSEGWIHAVDLLQHPQGGARQQLETVKTKLAGVKDGPFYASQYAPAIKVFSSARKD